MPARTRHLQPLRCSRCDARDDPAEEDVDRWWAVIATSIRTRATNAKTEAAIVTIKRIQAAVADTARTGTTSAALCSSTQPGWRDQPGQPRGLHADSRGPPFEVPATMIPTLRSRSRWKGSHELRITKSKIHITVSHTQRPALPFVKNLVGAGCVVLLGSACTQQVHHDPVPSATVPASSSVISPIESAALDLLLDAASWAERLSIVASPGEALNPGNPTYKGQVLETNPAQSLNETYRSSQVTLVGGLSGDDDRVAVDTSSLTATQSGESRLCFMLDFNVSPSSSLRDSPEGVTPSAVTTAIESPHGDELMLRNITWGVSKEGTSCVLDAPMSVTRLPGEAEFSYGHDQSFEDLPAQVESKLVELLSASKDTLGRDFSAEVKERESKVGSQLGNYTPVGWCGLRCKVNSRFEFEHPAWGVVSILTTIGPDNGPSAIVVSSETTGDVLWLDRSSSNYEYQLALDGPDGSGNIFVKYNPGRYDGIEVIRPTAEGMEVIHDDYSDSVEPPLFYSAALDTLSPGGAFDIEKIDWSCDPSCAEGKSTSTFFRWDGRTYALR